MDTKTFREMAEKWPSTVVARGQVKTFTGGALSGKTVANADSQGNGPEGRFKVGRQTVYPVTNFISWLEKRCSN